MTTGGFLIDAFRAEAADIGEGVAATVVGVDDNVGVVFLLLVLFDVVGVLGGGLDSCFCCCCCCCCAVVVVVSIATFSSNSSSIVNVPGKR
jgi:hypothetical protein